MDELKERKARDLRLKILKVEKELTATLHKTNLGSMLRAAQPSMLAKAERDRKRLEEKLEDLKTQLANLEKESPIERLIAKAKPTAKSVEIGDKVKPARAKAATGEKKTAAKKSAAAVKGSKSQSKNPPRPEASSSR